jgi:predicted nucleic acid-binding protein
MILVDTSVWIDHFAHPINTIFELAEGEQLLTHPFILGELALGSIKNRRHFLETFAQLPMAIAATNDEVLALIEHHSLFGRGIGYLDAHLIASVMLTDNTKIWTFDRRMQAVVADLECAADLPGRQTN